MTYGVPSVLSVSPWRMVFRRSCQCHHDVWCSVGLVSVTMRRSLRLHVIARSEATWQSFISGQKNKPHKNAEPTQKHKTLMKVSSHKGDINILAFFQVVASGQISPHFRGAKVVKFFDLQTFSGIFCWKDPSLAFRMTRGVVQDDKGGYKSPCNSL